jgi:hypothetical protein
MYLYIYEYTNIFICKCTDIRTYIDIHTCFCIYVYEPLSTMLCYLSLITVLVLIVIIEIYSLLLSSLFSNSTGRKVLINTNLKWIISLQQNWVFFILLLPCIYVYINMHICYILYLLYSMMIVILIIAKLFLIYTSCKINIYIYIYMYIYIYAHMNKCIYICEWL